MVEAYNLALEFITQEIQNLLQNQGLNQQGSQLDQNFCLEDKDAPPPPKKKRLVKLKSRKKNIEKYLIQQQKLGLEISYAIFLKDVSKSKIWIIFRSLSMYTRF